MPITRTRTLFLAPDDNCHGALLAAAAAARISLHALIFGFTLPDLAEILVQKHQEGLRTGVVADKVQSAGRAQKRLLDRLALAGVPVTITTSHGYFMHLKVLLVDHELGPHDNASLVAYGSYNFTKPSQLQANSLLVDNDPALCSYMWERYERSRAYGASHYAQDAGAEAKPPAKEMPE